MPCDTLYRLAEQERRIAEQRRERELELLEQDLAAGIAQIVVSADGTVQLLGNLPAGMQEACTMAALQRRNSQEFQQACYNAGVYDVNFVELHGHSH